MSHKMSNSVFNRMRAQNDAIAHLQKMAIHLNAAAVAVLRANGNEMKVKLSDFNEMIKEVAEDKLAVKFLPTEDKEFMLISWVGDEQIKAEMAARANKSA